MFRTVCLTNAWSSGVQNVFFSFSVSGPLPPTAQPTRQPIPDIELFDAEIVRSQVIKKNVDRDAKKTKSWANYPQGKQGQKFAEVPLTVNGVHGAVSEAVRAVHQRQADVISKVNAKLDALKQPVSSGQKSKHHTRKTGSKKKY